MKKFLRISIITLLVLVYLMIGLSLYASVTCTLGGNACTPASHNCDTCAVSGCEKTDIQTAITGTMRNGLVTVGTGTCNISGAISMDRAIELRGSGVGNTILKNASTGANYILSYTTASATLDSPYKLKITGFTFDPQYQAYGLRFQNRSSSTPINIVLGDNNFTNLWDGDYTVYGGDPMSNSLLFYGRFIGVVYNNTFSGFPYLSNEADGVTNYNDAEHNVTYGSINYVYYEDNDLYSPDVGTYPGPYPFIVPHSNGAKYVARYNDFRSARPWYTIVKPWSPHHARSGTYQVCSGKGGEFYGNYLYQPNSSCSWTWGTPRAGKNMLFNNRIIASTSSIQWTLYNPSTYVPCTTLTQCGSDTLWSGLYRCDPSGQPQHVYKSYQFNNRYGITGAGTLSGWSNSSPSGTITENREYYNQGSSYDGTTGVGCGTLAARPATCVEGTAYWIPNATIDTTASSCSNLTGYYGRNNAIAASVNGNVGTLHICGSNNWVNSTTYTPFTYPHPWRGTDSLKPTNVLTSVCAGADCTTPLTCSTSADVVITVTASDNVAVSGLKACLENGTTCTTATTYANMGLSLTNTTGNTWTLTLEDVVCDGTFAYNIKSVDSSGNESDNLVAAFDTDNNSDITNPTLDTVVFDGTNLTLTFSEAIKDSGTYANTQWNLTVNGTPVGITCAESWNADTLTCTPASCIASGTTLLLDYNQPVTDDAITDIAGNPLADITDKAVTNNSGETCGTPTTTSLWPHDSAPSVTSTSDNAGNYGLQFSSTSGGYITHGWFYKHANMDGQTHTWSLWDSSGTELARKVFSGESESGWQSVALDSSIEILPSTNYRISLNTSGTQRVRTANYFANAYTNGTFTVPFAGGYFLFSSSIAYPTSQTTTNSWVDFTFSPTGSTTWDVTVTNGSAAGYKCNVALSRVVDNGNTTEIDVTVANGWKASFSGCGSGSTVQDGNEYTYTTAEITEDCTVEVTCAERYSPLWLKP